LSKRFETHRKDYNSWKDGKKNCCSCFPYFDKYGIENFKIVLIKSYDVVRTHIKDRKHLEAYETLWICKTKCVNQILPIQYLKKEKIKKYSKEYREENKDKINKYSKEYYEKKKESIIQKNKEYREKNKDKIQEYREKNKEKRKQYNEEYRKINRDEINERKKEKVKCECGTTVSRRNISTHCKTNKHKKLLLLNK
jgi:ATP-dependent Lon protease